MILVESVFNYVFFIEDIDDLVYLLGESIAYCDDVVILTHLLQKMLRIRPENKVFRLLCPIAKDLNEVNNQGVSLRRIQIWIWSHS